MENPISMDPTFVSPQIVMLATAMQAKKEKCIPSLGISFSQNNCLPLSGCLGMSMDGAISRFSVGVCC